MGGARPLRDPPKALLGGVGGGSGEGVVGEGGLRQGLGWFWGLAPLSWWGLVLGGSWDP